MSCDIPVHRLREHPRNSNAMSADALRTLRRHIRRSGRYEPLVVRPLPAEGGAEPTYQVLNGHHRLRVLRDLGHAVARCEVWEVDDREALLLLATLNRLEGRDEPMKRAALLADLAADQGDLDRLVELLPEDRAALDKALALARQPLPLPAPPEAAPPLFEPMTFFLSAAQLATVKEALALAARDARSKEGASPHGDEPGKSPGCHGLAQPGHDEPSKSHHGPTSSDQGTRPPERGRPRAAALVVLAENYLRISGATATPKGSP